MYSGDCGSAADLAVALARWGQVEEARPPLELARRSLDGLQDTVSPLGWVRLAEAELALADRDAELALEWVANSLPLLEVAAPAGLAQAHRVAAIAQTMLHHQAASSHWTASVAAAVRCGQRVEELRTRHAMAMQGSE